MTPTTSTVHALRAAVAADPFDHTPRLVLADALQEANDGDLSREICLLRIGATEGETQMRRRRAFAGWLVGRPGKCEECKGKRNRFLHAAGAGGVWRDCPTCSGSGDSMDRRWGKWMQLELDRADGVGPLDAWQLRDKITLARAALEPLLRRGARCWACSKIRNQQPREILEYPCSACCGNSGYTGALAEQDDVRVVTPVGEFTQRNPLIPVTWHLALPQTVSVTVEQLMRAGWAGKVWSEWQGAVGVEVSGKEPRKNRNGEYGWYWRMQDHDVDDLPPIIHDELTGYLTDNETRRFPGGNWRWYDSRASALAALGRAAWGWCVKQGNSCTS